MTISNSSQREPTQIVILIMLLDLNIILGFLAENRLKTKLTQPSVPVAWVSLKNVRLETLKQIILLYNSINNILKVLE